MKNKKPISIIFLIFLLNFIVINTDDALLICRRDKAQDVKKVIEHLKFSKMTDHL